MDKLPLKEQKKNIRLLLRLNWDLMKAYPGTDYTRHPHSVWTQLAIKMAEFVREPGEALCAILMHQVRLSGPDGDSHSGLTLKEATEDNDVFSVEEFFYDYHSEELIHIPSLFRYAVIDPRHLFVYDKGNTAAFHLDPDSQSAFRNMVGSASAQYFDVVQDRYTKTYVTFGTLAAELAQLQKALLQSSKHGNGDDAWAALESLREPVFRFYQYWRALDLAVLLRIKPLQYQGDGGTFDNLISIIFYVTRRMYTDRNFKLTAEELRLATHGYDDPDIDCTDQLQQQVSLFLS